MARKGENIYKRKDGRWEARYIKGYSTDGKAKYGYCYGTTYRETKQKVLQKKAAVQSDPPAAVQSTEKRFAAYCDEWLMLNRLKVKESTYVKYYAVINTHIKPKLGGFLVPALTSFHAEEFTQELLLGAGLSPKTVKDILVVLKSILKYAQKEHPAVAESIEIVYPKEEKKQMRVLTREEQVRFTEYLLADMDSFKFGVMLTLMTGLRVGEICALRWSDISPKDRVIRVGATMQRIKNLNGEDSPKTKIIISEPKTGASMRLIPLTDFSAGLCERFENPDPCAFVLSGSSEHFVEPRTLQNKLKKYTRDCGLEGVHYHTLRHSFATRCIEVDFELKSLSEILGHSSPTITLERYIHSSMELKRSNMNKLSAIGY